MFVIMLTYKASLATIDKHLAEHRAFLEQGYQKDFFIASGPQNPRTGGVILSQLKSREQLESILKNDPFQVQHIAEYKIIEFDPVKYHTNFATFI